MTIDIGTVLATRGAERPNICCHTTSSSHSQTTLSHTVEYRETL